NSRAARAKRRTNRHFVSASARASQQQTRDVCAGDEQYDHHRAQQYEQRSANIFNALVGERSHLDVELVGMAARDVSRNVAHCRLRLIDAGARLQSSKHCVSKTPTT